MARTIADARPDVIIHQLTALSSGPGTPGYAVGQEANRRLRIEGTRNLVRAAKVTGVSRVIAQSIAFVYAPSEGMHSESDPLDVTAEPPRLLTVQGIVSLEREVLQTPSIAGCGASVRLFLRARDLVCWPAKAAVGPRRAACAR